MIYQIDAKVVGGCNLPVCQDPAGWFRLPQRTQSDRHAHPGTGAEWWMGGAPGFQAIKTLRPARDGRAGSENWGKQGAILFEHRQSRYA